MDSQPTTDKPTNTSDYPIFRDRYTDPISYDGNPACIPGVMHEIELAIKRTGQYQLLFEQRAVPLSNGSMAIDQADNITFIEKRMPHAPRLTISTILVHQLIRASTTTTSWR